jgi:hypothetical protein
MKLPYRNGDTFELPLGTGASAVARIERIDHHVVQLAFGPREGEVAGRIRTYDNALVLQRWRIAARASLDRAPAIALDAVTCAHAERIAAAALGAASFDEGPLRVRAVRAERMVRAVRVTGPALARPGVLRGSTVERLILGGDAGALEPLESVRVLEVQGRADARALAASFPNVRALRWAARGVALDVRALADFAQLERLDCSEVALESPEALASLPRLRAVRLARVTGVPDLASIAIPQLRELALEHVNAAGLGSIAACTDLEQLELLGFWQHDVPDVAFVRELAALQRAQIDLGGRRKNVEVYRNVRWAYPWPQLFSGEVAVLRS